MASKVGVLLNLCIKCDKCSGLYTATTGDCLYLEIGGKLYTPVIRRGVFVYSVFYNTIKEAGDNIRPVKDREDLKEILKKGYDYAG
jgi:hypothetical protein